MSRPPLLPLLRAEKRFYVQRLTQLTLTIRERVQAIRLTGHALVFMVPAVVVVLLDWLLYEFCIELKRTFSVQTVDVGATQFPGIKITGKGKESYELLSF